MYKNTKMYLYLYTKIRIYLNKRIFKMAGRPKKEDCDSVSFAIYLKTRIILDELKHTYLKEGKNVPLKEIAHRAIEEYAEREKTK